MGRHNLPDELKHARFPSTGKAVYDALSAKHFFEWASLVGEIVQFTWSGSNCTIKPKTTDTGTFSVGNGTLDIDYKWFGGSTSKYILFDVGNARLQLEDIDMLLGDNDKITFGDGSDVAFYWNGSYLQGGSGMWANAPSPADANYASVAHEFFDDFNYANREPVDAKFVWHEEDDAGTGTNALTDTVGGCANIITAAADNDYHAISSLNEIFLFASGKKLWFEAKVNITEATTNESVWWVGLTDTLTTGGMQANAAGPLASYDGALIWSKESSLEIFFETSNAGTQATTAAKIADEVSGTAMTVGFYFDGTATTSVITPYINGVAAEAENITLSGLEEMHVVAGVKAGPSAAAETFLVDYIKVVQLR